MRFWWYIALPVLLLTQYCGATVDDPGSAKDDLVRYADDIYSQSGGVRVRHSALSAEGVVICEQFMRAERQAQRAFLWRHLQLDNIHFVHSDASWVTRMRKPTLLFRAVAVRTARQRPALRGSSSHTAQNYNLRELLLDFPPEVYPHLSMEHILNNEWDVDHLPLFHDTLVNQPRYNDKPDAALDIETDFPADEELRYAYNDPRYRESDAVVNYRVNWQDLLKERLGFLSHPRDTVEGEMATLDWALNVIKDNRQHEFFQIPMIQDQLRRRTPDMFDIDVNVDALRNTQYARETIYKVISEEIDALIERVVQRSTGTSTADATKALQEIVNKETRAADEYTQFNDPRAGTMDHVQLDHNAPLRDNIEKVYQRARVRREEFHKMTEPVVVNQRGSPTYRVHYTDPELRYVTSYTALVARKPKRWYEAIWKRLLEPIFKDAVLEEFEDIRLRNIVLVYADDHRAGEEINAYATKFGADIVVHCEGIDHSHARIDYVLRHEYEHIVDFSMGRRTADAFQRLEHDDDVGTLTEASLDDKIQEIDDARTQLERAREAAARVDPMEDGADVTQSVETARQRWVVLEASRATWEDAKRELLAKAEVDTFNVDDCGGFVSCYAQTDLTEAVAEQRYAMRDETVRTALLRRMSLASPGTHAARQKEFYDISRQEIEHVAPQLHRQWGEHYDNVEQPYWGLLPGETAKVDRHHQIVALDESLATKMASEKLAAYFLQRGYDVAIMGRLVHRVNNAEQDTSDYVATRICKLQSNLHDPPRGVPHRTSILHIVGGTSMTGYDIAQRTYHTFVDFTPTGRRNSDRKCTLNLEEISFVRSPYDPYRLPVSAHAHVLSDFRSTFHSLLHGPAEGTSHDPIKIALREDGGIGPHDGALWPRDANLYRETIFHGWFIANMEVWDTVDEEEQIACMPL